MDIFSPDIIMTFITLSGLEIVLGIDNLIFIALVVQNLPKTYRRKARIIGLVLALVIRGLMLLGASWIMSLTHPILTVSGFGLSFKDLMLLGGGLFLIAKATFEMHADMAGEAEQKEIVAANGFFNAVLQIAFIDFVFSFDSIITAVGMTSNLEVIFAAILVSMAVMLFASGYISEFLQQYPTFKMLALAFILMIGVLLMAEGLHFHFPRQYVYVAFAFSIFVEIMNTIASKKRNRKKGH
jgi:predicted tellurium resistance membrane protein TerC